MIYKKYPLETIIVVASIVIVFVAYSIFFKEHPEQIAEVRTQNIQTQIIQQPDRTENSIPDVQVAPATNTQERLSTQLQKQLEEAENKFQNAKLNYDAGVRFQLPERVTRSQLFEKASIVLGQDKKSQLMAGIATMFESGAGESEDAGNAARELLTEAKGGKGSMKVLFEKVRTLPSKGFSEQKMQALLSKFGADMPDKQD